MGIADIPDILRRLSELEKRVEKLEAEEDRERRAMFARMKKKRG